MSAGKPTRSLLAWQGKGASMLSLSFSLSILFCASAYCRGAHSTTTATLQTHAPSTRRVVCVVRTPNCSLVPAAHHALLHVAAVVIVHECKRMGRT